MQTSRWRYALRAMGRLAAQPSRPVGAGVLARAAGGDEKFMYAILRRLVDAGLLHSARGRIGGYRLARPPGEITAFEVVDAVDPERTVSPCTARAPGRACDICRGGTDCLVRRALDDAEAAFFDVLRSRTLIDIAETATSGELLG
ncbi:MAG TPA: Rrf2 family transcriptional regulator [Phenylobacterium sp.]|nr:Rrf2 family transcriptional regulator [Phenylobacterium sp.]